LDSLEVVLNIHTFVVNDLLGRCVTVDGARLMAGLAERARHHQTTVGRLVGGKRGRGGAGASGTLARGLRRGVQKRLCRALAQRG
jgi:tryptophan 2,3-dioxygenase